MQLVSKWHMLEESFDVPSQNQWLGSDLGVSSWRTILQNLFAQMQNLPG